MAINKNNTNVVVIFAKKPELGKVKTRIAKETSNEFAYGFSKACFSDLLHKINSSKYYNIIVATDSLGDLRWFQDNFSLDGIVIENSDDLNQSEKFDIVFDTLLNDYGYEKSILIPMDIPFINEEDIIAAFARLDNYKFVHGPEVNGGVYLIGIKQAFAKGIFDNIRWSTSHSYSDLVGNCGKDNTYSLKLKNDLNLPGDILSLHDDIRHGCPVLYEFLKDKEYFVSVRGKYVDFDDLSICIPVVVNIIERNNNNEVEVLLQTRYKPSIDSENSGKLEVPSGLIDKNEPAYDAAIRETKEETGINCEILSDFKDAQFHSSDNKKIVSYRPMCCLQQLIGDRSYIATVFISQYINGELKENLDETRNPKWYKIDELKGLTKNSRDDFFGLSLAALEKYLDYRKI